jgi:AcrR family transcriptional regulator
VRPVGTAPTPYPVAARTLLRDTLFDAAREQLRSRPWSQVTMAEVAKAAGLSRQTMYNEFGSRDAFAQAFVLREAELFLSSVEEAIARTKGSPSAAARNTSSAASRAAEARTTCSPS